MYSSIINHTSKLSHRDRNIALAAGTAIYESIVLLVVFALSFLLPRHIRPEAFQEGSH